MKREVEELKKQGINVVEQIRVKSLVKVVFVLKAGIEVREIL